MDAPFTPFALLPAPKYTEVIVTEEDIAYGIPLNPSLCPIARALNRAFERSDPAYRWAVAGTFANSSNRDSLGSSAQIAFIWLSPKVQSFISRFDARHPVTGFRFMAYMTKEDIPRHA